MNKSEPTRILVVDDEPEFRAVLAEYLEARGFEVAAAEGGEEALRRIPEFYPHLVLLDLSMPGLSGLETLRRIKALPAKTPVIMVSGADEVQAGRESLAEGAADYLPKPVDFNYLDTLLEIHAVGD